MKDVVVAITGGTSGYSGGRWKSKKNRPSW